MRPTALLHNEQVRAARGLGISVILVHECDDARGGCEFGHFFQTTPGDLISDGLYGRVAVAFQGGQHRTVSLCLLAREIGAVRYRKNRRRKQSAKRKKAAQQPEPKMAAKVAGVSVAAKLAAERARAARAAAASSELSRSRERASGSSSEDEGPKRGSGSSSEDEGRKSSCSVGKLASMLARADDKRLEITPELVEQTKVVELIRTPRGLGLRCQDDGLGQCRVVGIVPDSQAGRSGAFAVHDRIVALNGYPLTSYDSLKEA